MHHIYTTEGMILRSYPKGEANIFIDVLTKDLGLVGASAQGVRLPQSKLRSNLLDYTSATVSLVRGRNGWKLTNARAHFNLYSKLSSDRDHVIILARVISLVRALCPGEEKNENLFHIISNAFEFLIDNQLAGGILRNFETILVLRIVHALGYFDPTGPLNQFMDSDDWSSKLLESMTPHQKTAISQINQSLKESQLVEG